MAEHDPNSDDFSEILQEAERKLAELRSRKVYDGLNCEVIKTIPDEHLWQAILDFIELKIGRDLEHDVEKVPALGPAFSAVYFLCGLEIEVNNGGFNQFFYNRGRQAVLKAKEGAELLGLPVLAGIISEALSIAEANSEEMNNVREVGTLQAFFESYEHVSFEAVDDKFLSLGLDLQEAIVVFIRDRCDLFEGKAND